MLPGKQFLVVANIITGSQRVCICFLISLDFSNINIWFQHQSCVRIVYSCNRSCGCILKIIYSSIFKIQWNVFQCLFSCLFSLYFWKFYFTKRKKMIPIYFNSGRRHWRCLVSLKYILLHSFNNNVHEI